MSLPLMCRVERGTTNTAEERVVGRGRKDVSRWSRHGTKTGREAEYYTHCGNVDKISLRVAKTKQSLPRR